MKNRVLVLLLYFLSQSIVLFAQRAYDGEVMLGYSPTFLQFIDNNQQPSIFNPSNQTYSYNAGSSSIADKNGRLAFACTNYVLSNRNGDSLFGQPLNYGLDMDKMLYKDQGRSRYPQSSIILPKGDNGQYYVFTTTMSDSAFDEWQNFPALFRFDRLTYHIVDMNTNGGKGEVIEKNKILMKDLPIASNRMTAVKHANGRDWWLVKPHQKEHLFYTFLVTEQGITPPLIQHFNTISPIPLDGGAHLGQSCFNR